MNLFHHILNACVKSTANKKAGHWVLAYENAKDKFMLELGTSALKHGNEIFEFTACLALDKKIGAMVEGHKNIAIKQFTIMSEGLPPLTPDRDLLRAEGIWDSIGNSENFQQRSTLIKSYYRTFEKLCPQNIYPLQYQQTDTQESAT